MWRRQEPLLGRRAWLEGEALGVGVVLPDQHGLGGEEASHQPGDSCEALGDVHHKPSCVTRTLLTRHLQRVLVLEVIHRFVGPPWFRLFQLLEIPVECVEKRLV